MTAHYNAYFIAKEKVKEIEASIYQSQDWNYNKVLPIFPQFDSTKSASLKAEIEDCIQKASISIQRHPGSRWEDDSYILVGKARFYSREFPDAIETYKYVNTHSENDNARHYALTELIKSFTEFEEFNNAIAVTDYLKKEKLNKENQKRLYLNSAYLYQKKGDLNKMVNNLTKAEDLYHASDKARINFIIGQIYHKLDFESEAFRYYKNVLRNHPKYELEFYAKLYMAQVTELAQGNDLKKIRKYFRALLKDPKNKEYQDKIYYELAGFELKNSHLKEAIENYKESVKVSVSNDRQKGLSYLSLGEIYYDSIKNFSLAKNYYDSAVAVLPKDEENYTAIKKRQEILADFVEQVLTIQKNDSLLHLSTLPQDSLLSIALRIVEEKRTADKERKKKERQAAINRARNISEQNGDNIISTTQEGSVWYFNNQTLLSRGVGEFKRKWGDRALEDNWRRSNSASAVGQQSLSTSESNISEATGEEEEIPAEEEAMALLQPIPKTIEEKQPLLDEIEVAYFNLGNIYNLRLEEDENAVHSFETLRSRFPDTVYEPEVLYQLFLLLKKPNSTQSTAYGTQLKSKFPNSIYAKLVDNPSYREESFAATAQLKKLYRKLYTDYQQKNFSGISFSIDSALQVHPENEFSDNLAFLKVLTVGQVEEELTYQYELNEFIKLNPESDLIEYAKNLAQASENFRENRYNSGKTKYIPYFEQKHFFVIIYDLKGSLTTDVPKTVDTFIGKRNSTLKTGNLVLNEAKSMIFINSFPTKNEAVSFNKEFDQEVNLKELFKGESFDVFVITEDNFDLLYKTKDISSYLNFFEKHYY
ncbi:MAG: methyltransferase [Bacteroidota bacterium]